MRSALEMRQAAKLKKGLDLMNDQKHRVQSIQSLKSEWRESTGKNREYVVAKNFQAAEQVRQHTLSQKQTKFLNDQLKSVLAVDKHRGQLHSYEEEKAEKQR